MSNQDPSVLLPLTDWDIGPVERHNMVVMRLGFVSRQHQPLSVYHSGRFYGLTTDQARSLAQQMLKAADQLDSATAPYPFP